MKTFKLFLTVLAVLFAVAGCKTYDQSFDWVEGSDIEGVSITEMGIGRGVIEFSITNNGQQDQTVVILPKSTIIGYRMYLNRTTNKANNPGIFKGEPRIVKPIGGSQISDNGNPNINGSFHLSSNDIVITPGETAYTQLYFNNWDKATENFIMKVDFLVREGEVRNRIVMEIIAEQFFQNSSSLNSTNVRLNVNGSLQIGK